jgi:hypothetical protein
VLKHWKEDGEAVTHRPAPARQIHHEAPLQDARNATREDCCRRLRAAEHADRFGNPRDQALEQWCGCIRGDVAWRKTSSASRQDHFNGASMCKEYRFNFSALVRHGRSRHGPSMRLQCGGREGT